MYEINYKNMKKGYVFYLMFLGVGIIFILIFGWFIFQGPIRRLSMDSQVKAYDIEIKTSENSDGNMIYQPTYYYTVGGKKYVYTMPYSSGIGVSKMKSQNTIYYENANPENCVSEYEATITISDIVIVIFILFFPGIGIYGIFSVRKRINKAKWLAQNGTLIKKLKYKLIDTGSKMNGREIKAIQVDYELPSGNVIKLTGDPRYDFKSRDEDGLVDLLIDPNDINNYYIDFNIN